jgi:hypothetical protein
MQTQRMISMTTGRMKGTPAQLSRLTGLIVPARPVMSCVVVRIFSADFQELFVSLRIFSAEFEELFSKTCN